MLLDSAAVSEKHVSVPVRGLENVRFKGREVTASEIKTCSGWARPRQALISKVIGLKEDTIGWYFEDNFIKHCCL